MGSKSKILWTDATWNPVSGCTRVSPGCDNCYARRLVGRFPGVHAEGKPFEEVVCHPDRLSSPLRWRRPRRVFVASMGDVFHPLVPFEFIAAIFGVMAVCARHTFQVLTKRPERAAEFFAWISTRWHKSPTSSDVSMARYRAVMEAWFSWPNAEHGDAWGGNWETHIHGPWPLRNVWLGTTVEDQERAEARIPDLLRCPAVLRFVSAEPLLGPVDLRWLKYDEGEGFVRVLNALDGRGIVSGNGQTSGWGKEPQIDWVIAGGESGPGARPMHPDWVRSMRDGCGSAGVPFMLKQWGEWAPIDQPMLEDDPAPLDRPRERWMNSAGGHGFHGDHVWRMRLVGKHAAGRLLDGVEHDAFPEVSP